MKKKFILKIAIDMLMTVLLLLLMARQITGESAHEWLGAGMMFLWIIHNIWNRNWYSHLFKGKYTTMRILQTLTNLMLFLSMIGLMVSGIILSREVFAFLPISGGIAMARTLHILSAFWGYVLMALHLGLHWNMVLGMVKKATAHTPAKSTRMVIRSLVFVIAAYGGYAFMKNQFVDYMFLKSEFVFFDFERPAALFFIEYFAVMGLFVFAAHYISKGVQRLSGRRKGIAEKKK